MTRMLLCFVVGLSMAFMAQTPLRAWEPPTIPVGTDAYLQWERWPYQQIGARSYMRSTYDRTGGNESADASHYLYQESNTFNVTLDLEGPGVLVFARYNHWHGSPWHHEVDHRDHVVQESSSPDPLHPVENSVFLPRELFPSPLAWTWSKTRGADLSWVPVPFEQSFRMAYTRTRYGTGYYIFQKFVPGIPLSQPIQSWNEKTLPDPRVLQLLERAGTDLAPSQARQVEGRITLPKKNAVLLADLHEGPSQIRAVEFSVPADQAVAFSRARLRVTWDGRKDPSIDSPVALFFGTGTFYNRDAREYLVKAFPVHVRFTGGRVHMACYFPMPFFREAKWELIGHEAAEINGLEWKLRLESIPESPQNVGYFHATYQDHPKPELGRDLVLLDTSRTESGGGWSGSFVGTSFIFTHQNNLSTLEGDPRFFFDDSHSPQCYGTGTEEWAGGGDYWGGLNMTLPFVGHPVGARRLEDSKAEEDRVHSAYRFLLADRMPFGKNARIQLEHGGLNQSTEHYESVAYWYGAPAASVILTDTIKVGNEESERAHHYRSPDASAPYAIVSRYELGPDLYLVDAERRVLYPSGFRSLTQPDVPSSVGIQTVVAYPAESDAGRKTTGTSEFTVHLDPTNVGVMLRRKLDYRFPNQRAVVSVADVGADGASPAESDYHPAGIWYLAGGNTCVYSDPAGELGETQHGVETSNRRFRDDEFLIPRQWTERRSAIRVRVAFTPLSRPLFPGQPVPELAWSELRYDVYCFVMPQWAP